MLAADLAPSLHLKARATHDFIKNASGRDAKTLEHRRQTLKNSIRELYRQMQRLPRDRREAYLSRICYHMRNEIFYIHSLSLLKATVNCYSQKSLQALQQTF